MKHLIAALAVTLMGLGGFGLLLNMEPTRRRGAYLNASHTATGGGNPDASQPDATDSSSVTSAYVTIIPTLGDSNAIGSSNTQVSISTSNGAPSAIPFNNMNAFFNAGSTLRQAVAPGTADTEIHYYGLLNQLSTNLGASRVVFAYSHGVGAQAYGTLCGPSCSGGPTANYTNAVTQLGNMLSACNTLYNGIGKTCRLSRGVIWINGNDLLTSTNRAQEVTNLGQLYTDWCATAMASPFSRATCPKLIVLSPGNTTRDQQVTTNYLQESSEILEGIYEACRDNPSTIICGPPGYSTPMVAGNQHFSAIGHRRNGIDMARIFQAVDFESSTYLPVMPNASTLSCTNNVVTVPITGGGYTCTGGPGRDVTTVLEHAHTLGFQYTDSQAAAGATDVPSITTASVSRSGAAVTLTLDRNCGSSPIVRYAISGEAGASGGSTSAFGTGGNVRMSSCSADYLGVPRYEWLQPFYQSVPTVTGSPSSVWSFVNTDAAVGAAAGYLSARNSTVTNGSAGFTIGFRLRINTSFTNQRIIIERYSPVRQITIRESGTSGAMIIGLSNNGTSDAYTCTSNTGLMVASTAANFLFVYDGGAPSFTIYKDGVAQSCASTTGTVPATVNTGALSPWTIFAAVAAASPVGTNGRISHVAIWSRVIGAVEALVIHATVADYRVTAPSKLEHYWPLQGMYSDVGYGPSKPLYNYGSMTFLGSGI